MPEGKKEINVEISDDTDIKTLLDSINFELNITITSAILIYGVRRDFNYKLKDKEKIADMSLVAD